ncbi:MAG TPA: DUF4287 domain-containing protein [Caulobacteraceae bacterium]|jgi:hypothetical protein
MPMPALTERQRRYFEAMQANLARNTGKTLDEWTAIAKACPETRQRAQLKWLKDNYGLLQNHGLQVLNALSGADQWDDEAALRAALWTDAASAGILAAVERAVAGAPDLIAGQRKAYTAWSRAFQFAALKPAKGGTAVLGLAVTPDASPRLASPKNEGWSERLKSKVILASPADVDGEIEALLKAAWERS